MVELISGVAKGGGKEGVASGEVLVVHILAWVTGGFGFRRGDGGGS